MQSKNVFVLLYIHTDEPKLSEILGVFNNKDDAVNELLELANYREKDGKLTQYFEPTNEYESFSFLKEKVKNDMILHDEDIYKIQTISLL
jgi:hypothetical protein